MLPKRVEKELIEFCRKNNVNEKKAREIIETLIKKYSYEPGEAIGVIAAQSISEPATQMTMRSYTLASQTSRLTKVVHGLPRLIEIFDVRNTFDKNMVIYLEKDHNTKQKAINIANKIKRVTLEDIVVEDYIDLINNSVELKLVDSKYADEVKKKLKASFKNIEVNIRGSKVIIKPKDTSIEALERVKKQCMKMIISGIKDIKEVLVVEEDNEWVIHTIGSNLKEVLKIPGIDITRTITNDIKQVEEVLGIEAARSVMFKEAKETLNEQGLEIDDRYLLLLVDMLTFSGTTQAIGRYGVSGSKKSVLTRANFEEAKKHLVNAAFRGERDDLNGIIENVMVGQVAPVGTGMVKVVVDPQKMQKYIKKR